jgi:long-chain fatty acid transport protein
VQVIPQSRRFEKLVWLAVVAFLCAPETATASPLFELTGGVQGNGGFNARAVESGPASTYFNPALLTDADTGIDLGVVVMTDQIGIHPFARPSSSTDIPVAFPEAEKQGGGRFDSYGLPTTWLQKGKPPDAFGSPLLPARPRQASGTGQNVRAYQVIGYVTKLFEGRLALGLYTMIPYGQYTSASSFFVDEREQYFSNSLHPELYSDRLTATSLAFGAGVKVSPELSLGVSATLALKTTATTPTFLNDVNHFQDIRIDPNVGVNVALAPHFGVVYQPWKGMQLVATVHTPQKFEVITDFKFLISNGFYQGAQMSFIHDYLPWQGALGGSYDVVKTQDRDVTVAATALYARWSDYMDRHGESPSGPYAWYDTIVPTVGVRYRQGPVRVLLDGVYQPSPVPNQTGRTNYVDSDRIGGTTGADYVFPLWGGKLRVGLKGQVHRIVPRETSKLPTPTYSDGVNRHPALVADEVPDHAVVAGRPLDGREGLQTNNPGWPGFASAGWLFGGGIHVSFNY